jgi:hypothetical protein
MVGRVKCPQFRVILSEVDALPGEAATQSKDPCLLDMQWDGLCGVSRPAEGRSVSPDAGGTVGPSTPRLFASEEADSLSVTRPLNYAGSDIVDNPN